MFLVMVALLQFVVNLNGELMNYNLITASIKTLYGEYIMNGNYTAVTCRSGTLYT